MKQDLQEWLNEHISRDELLHGGGLWPQAKFVRDVLPELLFKSFEEFEEHKPVVISTHTSISVRLPVYQIELPCGMVITMRCNFRDWKVSINSPQDINVDFAGLFNPETKWHTCHFEGFPGKLVYGAYASNKKQFSVEIDSAYDVYTFFWLISTKMKLR